MNRTTQLPAASVATEVLEARFGLRVASMLSQNSEQLPHDVLERLKFARQQALEQRQAKRALAPTFAEGINFGSSLSLFGTDGPRWLRWVSVLPLLVLVGGLFLIQYEHSQAQLEVTADVDAALLGDDLPPAAYRDAGFVEFLKTPRN